MIMNKRDDGSLRPGPAAGGPRAMIDSARERNRRAFFALVSRHLKGLHHFVRHELRYLEAVGDLTPGTVTPDDVVDAVLLNAHRQFVKHPPTERLPGWLVRLAREHLDAEVKRFASERQRTPAHIEDDVPETPPAEGGVHARRRDPGLVRAGRGPEARGHHPGPRRPIAGGGGGAKRAAAVRGRGPGGAAERVAARAPAPLH